MGTKHPIPRWRNTKGLDVLSGLELVWVFFSLVIPLVAVYVVVRLAVKHELAADRRRTQAPPESDDPVSS